MSTATAALKFTVGQLANLNLLRGVHLMGGAAKCFRGQPTAEFLELEQMGMVEIVHKEATSYGVGITKDGLAVIESLRSGFHFEEDEE